jgi:hypothetical protein
MDSIANLALRVRPLISVRPWKTSLRLPAGIAVLAVLTFGIYYPALQARRVADDFILVGQVSFPDAIAYFGKTFGFGRNEYRPLTALSYAVDRSLWNSNPEGYHLTNLALHAASAGLLFLFLQALTTDFPLALLAGCLFVIHPINASQRVVWISARDGNVCAVFLLGALWLFALARKQNRRALHAIAVGLAACALLSYEGAVILPALIFLVELIFFASGPLRARVGSSFRRTEFFWILTVAYLLSWATIFSGKAGGYDLSLRPFTILKNYAQLISAFFFTRELWVLTLGCIVLLGLYYRMPSSWRKVAVFGVLVILIAFIPYCFTNGFADRFGYISAVGMSVLLAISILAGLRKTSRPQQVLVACGAVLLCTYYVVKDQKILSAWTTAGEIAARIPQAARALCPNPTAGTVFVFIGVPRGMPGMRGQVPIFQSGLGDAIQQEYPVKVFVRQYDVPLTTLPEQARHGAVFFEYRGGKHPLREIESLPSDG